MILLSLINSHAIFHLKPLCLTNPVIGIVYGFDLLHESYCSIRREEETADQHYLNNHGKLSNTSAAETLVNYLSLRGPERIVP